VSFSTATFKLRKKILFHLLKKHQEDVCSQCGKKIETIEELSIEHLKPWEGISVDLFWDIENIAFSHIRCNVPHKYNNGQLKPRPDGADWCGPGQHFAPVEDFYKSKWYHTGRQKWCKIHRPAR